MTAKERLPREDLEGAGPPEVPGLEVGPEDPCPLHTVARWVAAMWPWARFVGITARMWPYLGGKFLNFGLLYGLGAEGLRRQKEIYEALHPWTRDGVRQNLALTTVESGDEDPGDKLSPGSEVLDVEDLSGMDSTPPFAVHVEKMLGMDKRTVQRLVRIAERLNPEAKEVVRGTPLEDNQRALLHLAKLPPDLQPRAARLMAEGVPPRLA
ncbi:MAG: hypothetical protein ACK4ZX_09405 [Thermus sp.]